MIPIRDAVSGGLVALLSEPLPAVGSSTQIFANAPAGTQAVTLTVRGGVLTINWGSVTGNPPKPTAQDATATNGIDCGAGTYDFVNCRDSLLLAKAIGTGVTSGWIVYWRAR